MENENTGMNTDLLDQSSAIFNERKKDEEQKEATQVEEQKIEQVQEDPRNQESWDLPAVAEELKSAVMGGIQDTASSIQTFPERALDTVTGEVSREKKEKGFYQPEWTPFVNEEDPILTKTLSLIHI